LKSLSKVEGSFKLTGVHKLATLRLVTRFQSFQFTVADKVQSAHIIFETDELVEVRFDHLVLNS